MDAPVKRFGNWFKTSITVRMLVVGFILLMLMIPLGFTFLRSFGRSTVGVDTGLVGR